MGQLTGTVKQILPTEKGISKAGKEWQKNAIVLTTQGEYPKDVSFTGMGTIVPLIENMRVGQMITVHYNLESREYNGKWYTDAKAWKIEQEHNGAQIEILPPVEQDPANESVSDGLPF